MPHTAVPQIINRPRERAQLSASFAPPPNRRCRSPPPECVPSRRKEPRPCVPPVTEEEECALRPGDGGRGVCSPSTAAATLSTITATLPADTASAQESAHPPAAVDTHMSDMYSGSSPMNFMISPVRPFNLLRTWKAKRIGQKMESATQLKKTLLLRSRTTARGANQDLLPVLDPKKPETLLQHLFVGSGFWHKEGKKYVNSEKYKTMQTLLCSCEGTAPGCVKDSVRKQCKPMVRMKRTSDHGWFFETVVTEHNHELADTIGEKRHWQCHNQIDPFLKDVIRHMRGNNIPLNQVYGVLCDWHGGSDSLPFRKRSLRATCSMIAQAYHQCLLTTAIP